MTTTEREQFRLLVEKFKAQGKLEKKPEPARILKGKPCPKCGSFKIGEIGQCLYCGV